ncbi:iron ABC transporter permease [Haladaptatus sp. DJG-WS-42]|uniref:ABC transporter permease n=1 Tax=Haladaptatus sp. DJG-WS-42 TaxID=3120516 RepID=UPI0030D60CD5
MSLRDIAGLPERSISRQDVKHLPMAITLLVFIAIIVLFASIFIGTLFFSFNNDQAVNIETFERVFLNPETYQLLWTTLLIGVLGGTVSVVVGGTFAWLVVRTNVLGKRWLRAGILLSITVPGVVRAIGWILAFSPRIGFVNIYSQKLLGFTFFNIYSFWGIVFAIGFGGVPLAYIILEPALKHIGAELEEASRISGYGPLTTFRKVTIRLMAPGLISVFLLITLYGFGNFEYPLLFGSVQGGLQTLATRIYFLITRRAVPQYDEASVIALIYLVVALVIIAIYHYVTQRTYRFETVGGSGVTHAPIDLGRYKYLATSFCFFIWFVEFVIPILTVLLMSLSPNLSIIPGLTGPLTAVTFRNYVEILGTSTLGRIAMNTLFVATVSALGTTLLSVFISYAILKTGYSFSRIGDYIATLSLGIPPIVYGLAIFWMVFIVPGFSTIYGTIYPLVIAIVFLKIPHAVRIISTSLIQISDELEEAAQIVGWGWLARFRRITLPLLAEGIVNSMLFIFVESAKELSAIILLLTAGNYVLSAHILLLYERGASFLPQISAISMLFIIVLTIFILLSRWVGSSRSY